MCCDTKQKIAQALRQLMLERPLKKITVQDLMERTQMKRQTFYYHFLYIYDVLVWICRRQLVEPLERPDYASFEEWLTTALELLDRDRQFYRRAMAAADPSPLNALCEELLRPRLRALLFGCREERLDENQRFVLDFAMHAVMDQLRRMLLSLSQRMADLGIALKAEEEAVAALAAAGMADKSGARALRRILRTQVEDAVAEEILSGHLRSGDTAVIVRQGEGVSVRCAAGVT